MTRKQLGIVITGEEVRARDSEDHESDVPNFDPTTSQIPRAIPLESLHKKIVKINEELSKVHERKGSNFLESLNE